jgi:wyosine [tRNA(Phe)-imidazoG37] synthetase (radical SAM superfamily)
MPMEPFTVFGPVPSRRLGRSLGINNIPAKNCSYGCVYCQLGNTTSLGIERREFYSSETVFKVVARRLTQLERAGESVDFLTFVPDGEPTLDRNLGKTIALLKSLDKPLAVITNGSLLFEKEVRGDLMLADWVSVKTDSVNESMWRRINRPHGKLDLQKIHTGLLAFRDEFDGELTSETMLIQGMNSGEEEVRAIAHFLQRIDPDVAYLSVPCRPPAVAGVRPADVLNVNRAWQILSEKVRKAELLTGYEGNTFSHIGNLRRDILEITSVHPMREDAIAEMLAQGGADWLLIGKMLATGELVKTDYKNHSFYLRKF